MGGLEAMTYAARHPAMFAAAASSSGLLHTRDQGRPVPGPRLIQDLLGDVGEDPDAPWGDLRRHRDSWAAHNPYDLAPGSAASPCSSRSAAADPARSTGLGQPAGTADRADPSARRASRS
jgi:S-formylglutathione hydrolase FrmB